MDGRVRTHGVESDDTVDDGINMWESSQPRCCRNSSTTEWTNWTNWTDWTNRTDLSSTKFAEFTKRKLEVARRGVASYVSTKESASEGR